MQVLWEGSPINGGSKLGIAVIRRIKQSSGLNDNKIAAEKLRHKRFMYEFCDDGIQDLILDCVPVYCLLLSLVLVPDLPQTNFRINWKAVIAGIVDDMQQRKVLFFFSLISHQIFSRKAHVWRFIVEWKYSKTTERRLFSVSMLSVV